MIIELKKFGNMLISRQAGREALAAFSPSLQKILAGELIEIDFSGVITFSPSWGGEFLIPLLDKFKNRVVLRPAENPSVTASLEILEESTKKKFVIKKAKK